MLGFFFNEEMWMIIHKLCLFPFLIRITVDMVLSIGETFSRKNKYRVYSRISMAQTPLEP